MTKKARTLDWQPLRVGDVVEILNSRTNSLLEHRKSHPVRGVVIRRNGYYLYVRPYHSKLVVECYDLELRKVNK